VKINSQITDTGLRITVQRSVVVGTQTAKGWHTWRAWQAVRYERTEPQLRSPKFAQPGTPVPVIYEDLGRHLP